MTVYRNRNYTKRDYETTNVVACEAPAAPKTPDDRWVSTTGRLMLEGLTQLWTEAGVTYYGHL